MKILETQLIVADNMDYEFRLILYIKLIQYCVIHLILTLDGLGTAIRWNGHHWNRRCCLRCLDVRGFLGESREQCSSVNLSATSVAQFVNTQTCLYAGAGLWTPL